MFNLNEKYFSISERCGRNHQNKFCLRPLKGRLGPWELTMKLLKQKRFIRNCRLKYTVCNRFCTQSFMIL